MDRISGGDDGGGSGDEVKYPLCNGGTCPSGSGACVLRPSAGGPSGGLSRVLPVPKARGRHHGSGRSRDQPRGQRYGRAPRPPPGAARFDASAGRDAVESEERDLRRHRNPGREVVRRCRVGRLGHGVRFDVAYRAHGPPSRSGADSVSAAHQSMPDLPDVASVWMRAHYNRSTLVWFSFSGRRSRPWISTADCTLR